MNFELTHMINTEGVNEIHSAFPLRILTSSGPGNKVISNYKGDEDENDNS